MMTLDQFNAALMVAGGLLLLIDWVRHDHRQ